MGSKKVGVLALQGAFIEHEKKIKKCGHKAKAIRTAEEIKSVDALIIPGGESTTIIKLLKKVALDEIIKQRAAEGMPIYGTCAGMVLMAKEIVASEQESLRLINIAVRRNAFGRQKDSFEADVEIEGIGKEHAVFIRAPIVEKVWGEARVLAYCQEKIVMVEENNFLVSAFHPELSQSLTIHDYFLKKI